MLRFPAMRHALVAGALTMALALRIVIEAQSHPQPAPANSRAPVPRRVILLSVDAAADWIIDRLIKEGKAPTFARLAREGASAESMIGAMPSLTAVAHATLWTGTWSRFHGIVGNNLSILPRAEHTVLEQQRGFDSQLLTAEPVWITAARAGKRVLVLQATGAYPFQGTFGGRLLQFDVYSNRLTLPGHIEAALNDGTHRFVLGDTELTIRGGGGRTLTLTSRGTSATLVAGRGGAFGDPLPIVVNGREVGVRFRLVDYDPATGAFHLLHGAGFLITTNQESALARFRSVAGGMIGEQFVDVYQQGRFGRTLAEDGSGEAEEWLAEVLSTNQEYFERALGFAAEREWDLLVDYVPNFDAAAHALVGMIDPASSAYTSPRAERAWRRLAEVFGRTVDSFVAELRQRFPEATLIVTGDHGMEGTARNVLPNVALRKAGLLALTPDHEIDLAGSKAVFVGEKGNMVFVNSTDWKGGTVAPSNVEDVKRAAAAALLAIRDPRTGAPAVRAVYDVGIDMGLGIGGAAAGDLYFDPAPNYDARGTLTGDLDVTDMPPTGSGEHGQVPWRRKLQTIFYASGRGVARGKNLGTMQAIDVAPTVAKLLRIPPPKDAIGRAIDLR
ncbi:MAG: alkaline phosphatase family protein [Acidobacteria bacterium]|nr:alkaline phosphatase family protein [Acidobacteriota bacterium]